MRRRLALVALAAVAALAAACTTAPPVDGGATSKPGRCAGTEGVTVVVDFAPLRGDVGVRCALGPQPNGLAALSAAGFAVGDASGPGTVCTLDGLPSQGFPYCWTTGGYWSYWKGASAGAPWTYSEWGPGSGPAPAPGSVEGWRFAPFGSGPEQPPRIGTSGPIVP